MKFYHYMFLSLTLVGFVACVGSEGDEGEYVDPTALSVGSWFEIVADDGVWATVAAPAESSNAERECRIPPGSFATVVDLGDDDIISMSLEMCGAALGGTFCTDAAVVEVTRFSLINNFRITLPVSSDVAPGDVIDVHSADQMATGDSECTMSEAGSLRVVRVRPQCNEVFVQYTLPQLPSGDGSECLDATLGIIDLDSLETWLY